MRKIALFVFYGFMRMIYPPELGKILRRPLIKFILKKSGKKISIYNGVHLGTGKNISIGDNSIIGYDCILLQSAEIIIGKDVLIGPRTIITTGNHRYSMNSKIIDQKSKNEKVVIEDDVWIGAGVLILPGVKISRGSVIGAGSVVTKDTKPYTINVGNPCKEIKKRVNN